MSICSKHYMKIKFERNKTSTLVVMYSLYMYFLRLRLRNNSKTLIIFPNEKRSHVSVWNWIQRFGSSQIYNKHRRISAFIIDETMIQIGSENCWLWICIESVNKSVFEIHISKERNMFVAEQFIRSLVEKYGKHVVYIDSGMWYPQACDFLGLKHRIHSSLEKSLIERVIQYFKDRTESFVDYYFCTNKNCDLVHVYNWIKLFVYFYYNKINYNLSIKGGEFILT